MLITTTEIFDHLKSHRILRNGLARKDCEFIRGCIEKNNYLQILYDYTPNVLLCILELMEEKEYYEQCKKIVDTIHNHNKVSGLDIKTRL